jgi:hypothetical protein
MTAPSANHAAEGTSDSEEAMRQPQPLLLPEVSSSDPPEVAPFDPLVALVPPPMPLAEELFTLLLVLPPPSPP